MYEIFLKPVLLALCLLPGAALAAEFHGYPCTKDCSGHRAGYAWAKQHGIDDEGHCDGKSNSFNEGCRAWVEELSAEDPPPDEPSQDTEPAAGAEE